MRGLRLHQGLSNSRSRLLPVQIGMTQSTSTTLGLVDQERSALLMHVLREVCFGYSLSA